MIQLMITIMVVIMKVMTMMMMMMMMTHQHRGSTEHCIQDLQNELMIDDVDNDNDDKVD